MEARRATDRSKTLRDLVRQSSRCSAVYRHTEKTVAPADRETAAEVHPHACMHVSNRRASTERAREVIRAPIHLCMQVYIWHVLTHVRMEELHVRVSGRPEFGEAD